MYVQESRVSYTIYNLRTAEPLFMIFVFLDLSSSGIR